MCCRLLYLTPLEEENLNPWELTRINLVSEVGELKGLPSKFIPYYEKGGVEIQINL